MVEVVANSSPVNSLKLCYWNIHGWSSKVIGDKLCDEEFLNKINAYDVVALAELHSEKHLSLPGFLNIKQKIRIKNHKGPKISGGLAVFIKNKYENIIEPISNKNPDSIWIKIKKESCGETEDIFIGSFYISPGNKRKVQNDFYTSFNEEIVCFKQKGIVLVQGDLNARVGNEPDFIEFNKYLDTDMLTESSEPQVNEHTSDEIGNFPPRNSEDKKTNPRGRDLLDICKVNDLLIANGRITGDVFGKFTSHQYNGSAVNDLLIPINFLQMISKFTVGDYTPWLSDHCPIYSNIILNSIVTTKIMVEKYQQIEPNFIFDTESRNRFSNGLKSAVMKKKVGEILEGNHTSTIHMGDSVKGLLMENAHRCKIKAKKIRNISPKSAPWFDGECENNKNEVRKFGNDLKKDPHDSENRQSLQDAKKRLKQLVSSKKRNYKKGIVNKMSQSHKSLREFWKLLGKLSDRQPKTSSFVSHSYITSHFRTLLNSKEEVIVPPLCREDGQLDNEITLDELNESAKTSLPLGKAVGVDNLSNEMIASLIDIYPELVLKLFNSILNSGEIMPDWVISYIVPIHKTGPRSDPSNYRGISLLSCLGKFFLSILNKRLTKFCIEKGVLSDTQLGFMKGNRCSDAHVLIQSYREILP